jgi:hypothetical protein
LRASILTGATSGNASLAIELIDASIPFEGSKMLCEQLARSGVSPKVRRVALGHVSDDCLMNLLKDLSSFPDDDASLLVQIVISLAGQDTEFIKFAITISQFALAASIEMITSSFNIER